MPHLLHIAAAEVGTPARSGFGLSCPKEVSSQAVAPVSSFPKVHGAVRGTLGGSGSQGCIVTHEKGSFSLESWKNSSVGLSLPDCSVSGANTMG